MCSFGSLYFVLKLLVAGHETRQTHNNWRMRQEGYDDQMLGKNDIAHVHKRMRSEVIAPCCMQCIIQELANLWQRVLRRHCLPSFVEAQGCPLGSWSLSQ
eukprot:jgi/Botrbrau1/22962/Bobra.0030s0034.1